MKHTIGAALFMAAVFPVLAYAMPDTVYVPGYFESGNAEGTLNTAVTNAINAGTLSTTVFKLKTFEQYVLTATITVPAGQHLTIVADDPGLTATEAPPQIWWSPSGGTLGVFNFDCFGDITLKNIWLLYFNGLSQLQMSLKIEDSPDTINGQHGTFENVIFDYSEIGADGSGAVSVAARHFRGSFTNCYFRNCTDFHFRYYGRAVSFPFNSSGWHNDSLRFVNCTFANLGYVLMHEGSQYTDFLSFNHCTFINTVQFMLENPWWYWLSITNSVIVNTFMYGDLGTDRPESGTFDLDSVSNFGFTPPFTDAQRHILFTNSAYCVEPWLVDYYTHNSYSDTAAADQIPRPQPMLNSRALMFFDTTDEQGNKSYPYMNRANLYDGVNPNFLLAPTNVDSIKLFLYYKWTNNADVNWAFNPGAAISQQWQLPENLRIGNATLRTAAMGGFPLGDLFRWESKSKYNQWKAQEATEDAQITAWLTNGMTDVAERLGLPTRFELGQNYPNPFNPTTKIDYAVGQTGPVSLKVYDLLGQEVATLFNGEQRIGSYTAEFDGTNLASGVYIYRLQSGTYSLSKKLVLMK